METEKTIDLGEINRILMKTLQDVTERKISQKQASIILKITASITKNIKNQELEKKVEFLELALKNSRR